MSGNFSHLNLREITAAVSDIRTDCMISNRKKIFQRILSGFQLYHKCEPFKKITHYLIILYY